MADALLLQADGHPQFLDTGKRHLAVATAAGVIRVFDVSRPEPKPVATGRFEPVPTASAAASAAAAAAGKPGASADSSGGGGAEIVGVRVNCDGTRVAILANRVQLSVDAAAAAHAASAAASSASAQAAGGKSAGAAGAGKPTAPPAAATGAAAPGGGGGGNGARTPDTRVFVYSCDSDRCSAFDTGPNRYPVFAAWDPEEPRLLAVQVRDLLLCSVRACLPAALLCPFPPLSPAAAASFPFPAD